jgi:sec-independent protein translocase protein TatB
METAVFDLSFTKILVLAVIALVIFGPKELPKIAGQAGRALRELRRVAEGAKNDLRDGLGPEFADFDIEDLNPRSFVRRHLLEDLDGDLSDRYAPGPEAHTGHAALLGPGEEPPFDVEAT